MFRNNLAVILLLLILVSCSSSKKDTLGDIDGPKWIIDPYAISEDKDEIAAVGMSDGCFGGLKVSIDQAKADAAANIASQIEVRISKITEDQVDRIQTQNQSKQNVQNNVSNSSDQITKKFSTVTKTAVDNVKIAGLQYTNIWTNKNGENINNCVVYTRAVIKYNKIKDYFKNNGEIYQTLLNTGIEKAYADAWIKGIINGIDNPQNNVAKQSPILNN